MPTKQLKIDGSNARVGIVNYSNKDNAMANPLSYLDDVYFHSDLSYVRLSGEVSGTVNFASVPRKYYQVADDC